MKRVFSGSIILKFVKEKPKAGQDRGGLEYQESQQPRKQEKESNLVASYFLSERCLFGFGDLRRGRKCTFHSEHVSSP